jgi:hypothetical protein
MQLLGPYVSNITQYYYGQLLDLLNSAVQAGDFGGGTAFNQAALDKLIAQAQTFSVNVDQTAGTLAIDENFNHPVELLFAQLKAIQQEYTQFSTVINQLISILYKDTTLLEYLINAANLQTWCSQFANVGGQSYSWDFGMGFGKTTKAVPLTDPSGSGLVYTNTPVLNTSNGVAALVGGGPYNTFPANSLLWTYDASNLSEQNTDVNNTWTDISFLANSAYISLGPPQCSVIVPLNGSSSAFNISGSAFDTSLPAVFVRTAFSPRYNTTTFNLAPLVLSSSLEGPVTPGEAIFLTINMSTSAANTSCVVYVQYYDSTGAVINNNTGNPIQIEVGNVIGSGSFTNLLQIPTDIHNIASAKLVGETTVSSVTTAGFGTYSVTATIRLPMEVPSPYYIVPGSVVLNIGNTYYQNGVDYVVTTDGTGTITFIDLPTSGTVNVGYIEHYPCYQCSVNQINWSPTIMLDYTRPYPDNLTDWFPVVLGKDGHGNLTQLPIVDELGNATGLLISLNGTLLTEYLLQVYQKSNPYNAVIPFKEFYDVVRTPVNINSGLPLPGIQAQLQIGFVTTGYMNAIHLEPTTTYPCIVTGIDVQGFTEDSRTNVFSGGLIIDRPTDITFETTLVGTAFITVWQLNYDIKQYQVFPDSAASQQAINDLQGVIPSAAQEVIALPVIFQTGYEYDFGFEVIQGVYSNPGVSLFVAGPFAHEGCPDYFFINVEAAGHSNFYICYDAYNSSGTLLGSDHTGTLELIDGECQIFHPSSLDKTTIASCTLYLKIKTGDDGGYINKYLLQVVNV